MTDFLPKGYHTPELPSNFMTLEDGDNSFRVISSAIVGYEWWVDNGVEGRRPVRVQTADEIPEEVRNASDDRHKARHFWAAFANLLHGNRRTAHGEAGRRLDDLSEHAIPCASALHRGGA